jgi:tetratricopeptide (TPR) repeat protein
MRTFQASASASETTLQDKMHQLEECVQFNNDALVYIKIGETTEARSLLQEASSILQKVIHQQQQEQDSATPRQFHVDSKDYGRYFKWQDLSSTLPTDDVSSTPISFSLFLQGLWINSGIPLNALSTDPRGLATIWWVVHFNLALSCHLLGIQRFGSEPGVRNSQQACQLYKTMHLALDYAWPSSDFRMLLLAAVLNNKACIYSEFGMFELASHYWSRFSTALDTMMKNSRLASSTTGQLRIYFRLALNVSIFRGSIAAAAA